MTMGNLDKHVKAEEDRLAGSLAATAAGGEKLTDEQQKSVDNQARALAEKLTAENLGNAQDQEAAEAGFVPAAEKFGPDGAVKSDLQRRGEEENARTLEQQKKTAAKKAPPAKK
jgi:hypothetical protein